MLKVQLLVFFWIVLSLGAQAQVLENYDGQWRLASKKSWPGGKTQMELEVDLISFPKSELRIKLPSESTVFVDGRLWFLTLGDTVIFIPTEEFRSEFGAVKPTLTVVSPNLALSNTIVWKVLGRVNFEEEKTLVVDNVPNVRFVPQQVKDFYFSALFIILFFVALYKLAYPYLLAVMVQPLSVINADDFTGSGNLQKFFSFDILFYILIVGMMISLGTVTGLILLKGEWLEDWVGLDYFSLLMIWLLGAFLTMILTVLKFIGIRIISYLFDLGKAEFSHFFYLLRLIVFGITLVILVGAYFVSNNFMALEAVFGVLVTAFFWFYILGVGGLFLIMMSRLSFKKYHLFTYLCIAELVPFLIFAKWIMLLGQ